MRHGKIVWCAAVMLAGLMSAAPMQAAAPPAADAACAMDAAPCDQMPPRSWLEQVQRLDQEQRQDRKGLIAAFGAGSTTLPLSCDRGREYTIVFRIQKGLHQHADNVPLPCRIEWADGVEWAYGFDLGMLIPPAHAVRRWDEATEHTGVSLGGWVGEWRADPGPVPGYEFITVVESLQRKLMELHEEGVFELAVDSLGKDRADVNIHYEPVYTPTPLLLLVRSCWGPD